MAQNPLDHERYRRASTYDPAWVMANQMGPNALWLMEALCEIVEPTEGMRVLDLGCGTAMTSIFLAREYGAEVWATDLWIPASENRERIEAAGVADRVYPIHAEAHSLPFADGFFDLIVSVDAYHYFGTDDLYVATMARHLRSGGRLGIVVPALLEELREIPEHLAEYWEWEFWSFHGPDWWRWHWAKSTKVVVEHADALADGWRDWLRWAEVAGPASPQEWMADESRREAAMLRADQGRLIGFARVVARKP